MPDAAPIDQHDVAVTHADAPRGTLATPDITVAQLVAAVPVVANFLQAFGVYHLSGRQVTSLRDTLGFAMALIVGDGIIRHGRSVGNTSK